MDTKTCTNCHQELPYSEYNARNDSADGLQARCKACLRVTRRKWYAENQETEYARLKAAAAEKRRWWTEYKATLRCEQCGENHPSCLDFHHKDPDDKDINLAQVAFRGWSVARIEKELAKCMVLCSNCHRKLHDKLRQ